MPVSTDIVATYRGPGRVVGRLLAMGQREDRALAIVFAACGIIFVSQWPQLARNAHLEGRDLNEMLGASLMAWLILAPLLLYGLSALTRLLAWMVGGKGTFYGARVALFWALLASSPLMLLHGLVAGFIGPGPEQTFVAAIWLAVFLWFWLGGLWRAERGDT